MTKVGFCCPKCGTVLLVSARDDPPTLLNGRLVPDSELLAQRLDAINWGTGFNVRIGHALSNNDLFTIADLIAYSEEELLRTPNLGKLSLDRIKQFLETKGLYLGMIND